MTALMRSWRTQIHRQEVDGGGWVFTGTESVGRVDSPGEDGGGWTTVSAPDAAKLCTGTWWGQSVFVLFHHKET